MIQQGLNHCLPVRQARIKSLIGPPIGRAEGRQALWCIGLTIPFTSVMNEWTPGPRSPAPRSYGTARLVCLPGSTAVPFLTEKAGSHRNTPGGRGRPIWWGSARPLTRRRWVCVGYMWELPEGSPSVGKKGLPAGRLGSRVGGLVGGEERGDYRESFSLVCFYRDCRLSL